jgi:anti-sigma B factor antagonist
MVANELDVRVVHDGQVARVLLSGRLDSRGAHIVRDALRPLWNQSGDRIVLDLASVEIVDVAGLAALLRLDSLAREAGWTVQLTAVPPTLERLLRETGLRFRFASV